MVGHRHLTEAQRVALLALFNECCTEELLLAIGGILRTRIDDCEHSEAAWKSILSARMHTRKGKLSVK